VGRKIVAAPSKLKRDDFVHGSKNGVVSLPQGKIKCDVVPVFVLHARRGCPRKGFVLIGCNAPGCA
jgi:hypothetical protein